MPLGLRQITRPGTPGQHARTLADDLSPDQPARRRLLGMVGLGLLAFAFPVIALPDAAHARGGSNSSGSGSGGSDDDEDEHDDHGGSGSGSGGSGSGNSGSGNSGSGNSGSGNSGSGSGSGQGSGDGGRTNELLWVRFRDGHVEQVRNGTFLRTNPGGRLVEKRRALRGDVSRLTAYRTVSVAERADLDSLIVLSASQNAAQMIVRGGWTELINGGIYQLTDPNGNLVTRRAATADDMERISAMAGLN